MRKVQDSASASNRDSTSAGNRDSASTSTRELEIIDKFLHSNYKVQIFSLPSCQWLSVTTTSHVSTTEAAFIFE